MPSLPPNVFSWLCKALQQRRETLEECPTKTGAAKRNLEHDLAMESPLPKAKQAPSLMEEFDQAEEQYSWSDLRRQPLSRSPGSTVSTEASPDLEPAPFDLDQDLPEDCLVLSAPLDPAFGLCLRQPCQSEPEAALCGRAEDLLRATRLELREGAGLRAIGSRSVQNAQHEEPEDSEVDLSADCLIIDVRADLMDDPRPIQLVGAQLRAGGRICGIALQQGPKGAEAMCEVRARRGQPGGQEFVLRRIEDIVEDLRSCELQRRNAEMLAYQRRVCSSLMGQQRRRLLGLPESAA